MTHRNAPSAEVFRQLHADGLLLLPNATDGGSARLFESLGAKAVATSSAAVAWSHGYADGNVLPVPLLIATVTDIARAVRVPVSVDVEGGYSDDPRAGRRGGRGGDRRGWGGHQPRGRRRRSGAALREDRGREAHRGSARGRAVRERAHRRVPEGARARGPAGRGRRWLAPSATGRRAPMACSWRASRPQRRSRSSRRRRGCRSTCSRERDSPRPRSSARSEFVD